MKVKVISRSEEEYTKPRSQDVRKVFRNPDPVLHPMERAHEYQRALNAVKLEKVFAKPFMGALAGHEDAVSCMAKNPQALNCIASGSMDGDVRLWDIAFKRTVRRYVGHKRPVRGMTMSADGEHLLSCGDDCTVRLWQLPSSELGDLSGQTEEEHEALSTYHGKHPFRAIDHRWKGEVFATAGARVDVWEHSRSEPINTFSWGPDSVYSVRFNPAEPDIFASAGSDRSIALYDLRMGSPLRKLIMQTRTNSICWNPREAFNFTTANEDCNCYSYDMRKLDFALCVHKGHVSSVMDVDFSSTGKEFVTGSYDRTVRIFPFNGSNSREVYHTKRMQRVFCVKFSGDGSYVLSGSDDTNIRLWKAVASQQLGVQLPREKQSAEYKEAVVQRFKHLPEIKRIHKNRHVPRPIFKAERLRQTMAAAAKRKDNRRRAHTKDAAPHVSIRKKRIVAEVE